VLQRTDHALQVLQVAMRCWYCSATDLMWALLCCSATDSLLRRCSEGGARRLVLLPRTGFGRVLALVLVQVLVQVRVRVRVQVRVRVVGRCRWW